MDSHAAVEKLLERGYTWVNADLLSRLQPADSSETLYRVLSDMLGFESSSGIAPGPKKRVNPTSSGTEV